MTPDDFVRSITPGLKQPYGLDLDCFKRYDPKVSSVLMSLSMHTLFDFPVIFLVDNALDLHQCGLLNMQVLLSSLPLMF